MTMTLTRSFRGLLASAHSAVLAVRHVAPVLEPVNVPTAERGVIAPVTRAYIAACRHTVAPFAGDVVRTRPAVRAWSPPV